MLPGEGTRLKPGRCLLGLMALVLAALHLVLFKVAAHTSSAADLQATVADGAVWHATLIFFVWRRSNPARALLAALLLVSAIAETICLPDVLAERNGFPVLPFLATVVAAQLLFAGALLLLPPLRRLTTPRAAQFFDFSFPAFAPDYRCMVR